MLLLNFDGSNVAIKDNVDASFALYTLTSDLQSGNLDLSFQNVDISGTFIRFHNLPTSNPGISGALWKDISGFLKIS